MEFIEYTRDVNSMGGDAQMFSTSALVPIFFPRAVKDPEKSREAGYDIYVDRPHIKLLLDNGLSVIEEEVEDVPSHPDKDWKRKFPMQWGMYEKGIRDTMVGTPLSMLFNSSPAKLETYKRFSVYTVEQLAAANDANITGMGLGAIKDREDAKNYISQKKEGAVYEALAREKANVQAKNDELTMQLNAQAAQMASLQAQLNMIVEAKTQTMENVHVATPFTPPAAQDVGAEVKRGRGRPKKTDAISI